MAEAPERAVDNNGRATLQRPSWGRGNAQVRRGVLEEPRIIARVSLGDCPRLLRHPTPPNPAS